MGLGIPKLAARFDRSYTHKIRMALLPVCTADDPRYTDMDTSNGHNAGRLLPAGLLSILVPYLYPNGLRILDITRLFVLIGFTKCYVCSLIDA